MNSKMEVLEVLTEQIHYPVLYRELIQLLQPEKIRVVVDCTVGVGSFALKFLEVMNKNSIYIGIDKDENSLEVAKERLKQFGDRVILIKDDFVNLDKITRSLNLERVDAFLFDLGISSYQLNDSQRGFSFLKEGPLDMRIDQEGFLSAYDLVNNLSQVELAKIFKKFGQERYSERIAKVIVEERKKMSISTTTQLAQLVLKAVPAASFKYKIHPATRVFLALRIAVNRELEVLKIGLEKALNLLSPLGRIAVISFHSLEDRIVKYTFKLAASNKNVRIITKKPIIAKEDELLENISSRSAKLRVVEKI